MYGMNERVLGESRAMHVLVESAAVARGIVGDAGRRPSSHLLGANQQRGAYEHHGHCFQSAHEEAIVGGYEPHVRVAFFT